MLSRIYLSVDDSTTHPSLTDCLHSALNGEPVILLHENQHFKLHCSDKFNSLNDSMQLYHCSKLDGCQERSFKPLNQSGYCNSCTKSIKENDGLTIMSSLNVMDPFPTNKRFLLQNLPKLTQTEEMFIVPVMPIDYDRLSGEKCGYRI